MKLSAVARANLVKTPTLIAVGDEDGQFLLGAIEMYNALRFAGADVTLLRYPHEGHVFTGTGLRDFGRRYMDFFRHYLEPDSSHAITKRSAYAFHRHYCRQPNPILNAQFASRPRATRGNSVGLRSPVTVAHSWLVPDRTWEIAAFCLDYPERLTLPGLPGRGRSLDSMSPLLRFMRGLTQGAFCKQPNCTLA